MTNAEAFHAHLGQCEQCMCSVGRRLLFSAVDDMERQAAREGAEGNDE